jgi:hypothetical protein
MAELLPPCERIFSSFLYQKESFPSGRDLCVTTVRLSEMDLLRAMRAMSIVEH